jgi:hypothetical protein
MKLYCERCRKKYRGKDDPSGKMPKCPDCGDLLVPRPESATPTVAAAAEQTVPLEEDEFAHFGAVAWQNPTSVTVSPASPDSALDELYPNLGTSTETGGSPTATVPASAPSGGPRFPTVPAPSPSLPGPRFPEIKRPGKSNDASKESDVENLTSIQLRRNWSRKAGRLPQFLVRGRGAELEKILQHFIRALQRSGDSKISLGFAAELSNQPGANRPLRIVHSLGEGHVSATDVVLRAQENDLYVRFDSVPNTWIAYLRWGLFAGVYALLAPLVLALYLFGFGAHKAWVEAYAKDHATLTYQGDDKSVFLVSKINNGCYVLDGSSFEGSLKRAGESFLDDVKQASRDDLGNLIFTMMLGTAKKESWETALSSAIFEGIAERKSGNEFAMVGDMDRQFTVKQPLVGDQQFYAIKRVEYLKSLKMDQEIKWVFDAKKPKAPKVLQTLDSAASNATHFEPPWTVATLFFSDPKLGLWHAGPAAFAITFLFGLAGWFIPITILNRPCRWLGWPTPDEFDNHVTSQPARIQSVLSDTLLYDFGVQEKDIINIAT